MIRVARSKNSRSWLMMMTVDSTFLSHASNQIRLSISRWFVGSSRSRRSAGLIRALARAKRLRQPPENSRTHLLASSELNPRPAMMQRASAFTAPSFASARAACAAASRIASFAASAALTSAFAACSGAWPARTKSKAVLSSTSIFCAT